MTHPTMVVRYVDSPPASAAFYTKLLGCEPVEASPTFTLFVLEAGLKLAFWSRHTVEPAAAASPGAGELGFAMPDLAALEGCHADWAARGLMIVQPPTLMDFGHSFMALDPDGHRLRVFALSEE